MTTEETTELAEIGAIKRRKARYFRLLDTKQWDPRFCDDCVYEGSSVPFAEADHYVAGPPR